MGKRGQIYILAAILLAVVVYGLSTVVNVVQQEEIRGDFEALSSNYEMESSKLINSVLQSGGDINDSFANFTFLFSSYSKSKSPGFNLFYALVHKDNIHFGNFMSENMIVYIPCPGSASCSAPSETTIAGCLANISAQVSFEGLNVGLNPDWDQAFNTILKPVCIKTLPIGANKEYCLNIGGEMYNLSIEPNVPKIFSFSRLKSGDQVISSAQGDIGQERVCTGRDSESECCSDFCCWDDEEDVCREGKCAAPEKCDGTIPCKKCYCDVGGEYCEDSSKLCKKPCDDGTRIDRCSTTKPKYCNSDRTLVDKCGECDCPDDDWTCQASGSCCVKEGESCDANRPCCQYHYCDGTCKRLNENCEDGFDNNGDGKVDCKDSQCQDYCSPTKPKGCVGNVLRDNCDDCGCPTDKPVCKSDGSCIEQRFKLRCESQSTYSKDCNKCVDECNDEGDCEKQCDSGDEVVDVTERDWCSCGWFCLGEKCRITCRDVYYTDCSAAPSCSSGYSQDGGTINC